MIIKGSKYTFYLSTYKVLTRLFNITSSISSIFTKHLLKNHDDTYPQRG